MTPEKPSGGSLFASLRGLKPEEKAAPPPSAPAPASPPAGSLQPLLTRLEKIESGLAEARQRDPGDRIAALEQQLKATQEQAIKAMVTLREREQAQQQAQRDLEALMKGLSAQRRSDELDRHFREQGAAQQRRIEELEAKLLAQTATPVPASAPVQESVLQRLTDLEGGLSRLRGEAEVLRQLLEKRASELSEAARLGGRAAAEATALVADQEQRAAQTRHELEAGLVEGLQRVEGVVRSYADQGLEALRAEVAQGRHGRQEVEARLAELSQGQARLDGLLQGEIRQRRQAEETLAAQCSAVLEAQRRAAAKTASGMAEQISELGRTAAEGEARAVSRIEELGRAAADREARAAARIDELGRVAADREARTAARIDELGRVAAEVEARAAAKIEESGRSVAEKASSMTSDFETMRAQFDQMRLDATEAEERWAGQLGAGRQELAARFDEELRRLDSWLRTVREQAQSWDQTRTLLAETAARVEQVGGFCDQGLRALDEKRMQFETEVRGLILARVLRLEERLGK